MSLAEELREKIIAFRDETDSLMKIREAWTLTMFLCKHDDGIIAALEAQESQAKLRERIKGRTPLPDSDDLCPPPYAEDRDERKGERRKREDWNIAKFRRGGMDRRQVAGTKDQRGAAVSHEPGIEPDSIGKQSAPLPDEISGGVKFVMGPGGDEGTRMVRPLPDRIDSLLSGVPGQIAGHGAALWVTDAIALLREARDVWREELHKAVKELQERAKG